MGYIDITFVIGTRSGAQMAWTAICHAPIPDPVPSPGAVRKVQHNIMQAILPVPFKFCLNKPLEGSLNGEEQIKIRPHIAQRFSERTYTKVATLGPAYTEQLHSQNSARRKGNSL